MNIDMMDSYGQSLKTNVGTLGAVFTAGFTEHADQLRDIALMLHQVLPDGGIGQS